MLTSSGGSLNADRGRGDKICQNLADVISEHSLSKQPCWYKYYFFKLITKISRENQKLIKDHEINKTINSGS